jgi:hypothetical protein
LRGFFYCLDSTKLFGGNHKAFIVNGFIETVNKSSRMGILLATRGNSNHVYKKYQILIIMLTPILVIAALVCFAIFFKSIDFFDKI